MRYYVENGPQCTSIDFNTLFPDHNFPENSTEHGCLNATQARDLLRQMLVIDPDQRISVDEAIDHPYINAWYNECEVNAVSYSVLNELNP